MANIERLTQLRAIIESKDPDLINMNQWRCDTQACALGWACLEPTFNKLGLSLVYGPSLWSRELTWVPDFEGQRHYAAGAAFFDLTSTEALDLFDPITEDEYLSFPDMNEKTIFLMRLDNLLEKHND